MADAPLARADVLRRIKAGQRWWPAKNADGKGEIQGDRQPAPTGAWAKVASPCYTEPALLRRMAPTHADERAAALLRRASAKPRGRVPLPAPQHTQGTAHAPSVIGGRRNCDVERAQHYRSGRLLSSKNRVSNRVAPLRANPLVYVLRLCPLPLFQPSRASPRCEGKGGAFVQTAVH